MNLPTHLVLGRHGEELAARYLLEKHGMVELTRNWRCPEGELDLILTDAGVLVFCEVKTRTGTRYGTPAEAVTEEKARRIRRIARRWRCLHGVQPWVTDRFDLVSILWPRGQVPVVNHLPAAF